MLQLCSVTKTRQNAAEARGSSRHDAPGISTYLSCYLLHCYYYYHYSYYYYYCSMHLGDQLRERPIRKMRLGPLGGSTRAGPESEEAKCPWTKGGPRIS